ncbi:hypothetical protein VA249_43500 (plasmid) [Vibrio alfacsensis]|nr:hypothetical protein [Vibrio sp. 04Ya108]BBM67704.1 hypothetical protein VA249_43500 [Vibrio alfacsensis]
MPDRAAIVSSFFSFIVIHPLVEVSVRYTYLSIQTRLLVTRITAKNIAILSIHIATEDMTQFPIILHYENKSRLERGKR